MTQTAALAAANLPAQAADDPQEARQAARQKHREATQAWDAETSRRRRPLYADVEELISIGFLSHSVRVGSTTVSLRSLSPGDLHLLSHRCGKESTAQWKVWAVANSIWMIDGVSLLEDPHSVPWVYARVRQFPRGVLDILFSVLLGLFNRTNTALSRCEAYCYEPYSRAAWRMCGRQPGVQGIPGAERLGLNHVQRLWVAYNIAEDDRDILLREWQAAKLVASAMSPKGIRKINESDERLQEREERRRRDVAERMVHMVLYGHEEEPETAWKVKVQGQEVEVPAVRIARTPDELEEQFRAWVAGEKDWHDLVVDTYKARIAALFNREQKERDEVLENLAEPGVQGGLGEGPLVGYTPEQLREFRPDLLTSRPGARWVADGSAPATMYEKYVAQEAQPGRLRADAHGVYEVAPEKVDLQSKVEQRMPRLSTEPMASGKGGS